jgi:D-beta-D-heptose 7-phosphate kinase/D-beta-D-heptose 1-phosphate adenosyltransferase
VTDTAHLPALLPRLTDRRLLCIGDLMLDRYVYGRVERISPEAPIPVLAVAEERAMLGGVGNVVRNVASLGGLVSLIGVVGDDGAGTDIIRLLAGETQVEPNIITVQGRPSTKKTRFVAGSQQLLRTDTGDTDAVPAATEDQIIAIARSEVEGVDCVLLSDYAKGTLTARVAQAVIEAARAAGKPVVVDPKARDLSRYRGASVLKPNAAELALAMGMPVRSDGEIAAAAHEAIRAAGVDAILATRSERGMTLATADGQARHYHARAREVFDVSGAGDTVVAALGLALAAGISLDDATALANVAASIVVGKAGTATVSQDELSRALLHTDVIRSEDKIHSLPSCNDTVSRWRAEGKRIGFTNGCFDLIHPGHVSLLSQARAACDRLIVGLNTDASVKRLKGPSRPVQAESARALVLASLAPVDMVVLFDEDTPMKLIEAIRPDVLVKGADYTVDKVVGGDFVQSYGGKVMLARLEEGHSTTGTIARMKS